MKQWSLSTTIRNPQRLRPYLIAFNEVNDENGWDEAKMEEFFIKTIQLRITSPRIQKLAPQLDKKLKDTTHRLTWDEAVAIYESKEFKGTKARVGSILRHLCMWGLIVYKQRLLTPDEYTVSAAGREVLYGELSIQEHLQAMLPMWKFPATSGGVTPDNYPGIRPYIATLALILEVNRLCRENGIEEAGIKAEEFDIYALTLLDPAKIIDTAKQIVAYRKVMESELSDIEKVEIYESERDRVSLTFDSTNSAFDYTDGIFRFFRISQYFIFPKGLQIININPDYMEEITKLTRVYLAFAYAAEAKKQGVLL